MRIWPVQTVSLGSSAERYATLLLTLLLLALLNCPHAVSEDVVRSHHPPHAQATAGVGAMHSHDGATVTATASTSGSSGGNDESWGDAQPAAGTWGGGDLPSFDELVSATEGGVLDLSSSEIGDNEAGEIARAAMMRSSRAR
jgi:hypothetical protein